MAVLGYVGFFPALHNFTTSLTVSKGCSTFVVEVTLADICPVVRCFGLAWSLALAWQL
jgi:hypothetical protein